MKNLKFILLSLPFVFTSCGTEILGDDTYSIEYVESSDKASINVTVESRGRVALGQHLDFTVSIDEALDSDAVVTVVAKNGCGDPISHLQARVTETVTIYAGDLTGSSSLIFPGANNAHEPANIWDGLTGCSTLSVSGIKLVENDTFKAAENESAITIVDTQEVWMDTHDTALVYCLDYKDHGDNNDYDLILTHESGVDIEFSETVDRYEGDYFNNGDLDSSGNPSDFYYPAPDGVYTLNYIVYVTDSDNPAELYFTHPTGEVDYISWNVPSDVTIAPVYPPDPSDYTPIATITVSTDSEGVQTYTVEEVN